MHALQAGDGGPNPPRLRAAKAALYGDPARRPAVPGFNKAGIPASLRPLAQWVPWKLSWKVDRKKPGKGKWNKVPLDPHTFSERTGCLKWAKSNDPATWADFDAVCDAASKTRKRNRTNVDGLGFVLARRDEAGEFGLDIDGCRDPETGELTPLAARVVREFATFTDVSPSDTGVKLLGRGRLPWEKGRKVVLPTGEELELYDRERFFTLTGRRVEGTPDDLADCQPALDALVAEFFPPEEPAPRPAKGKGARANPGLAPDDAKVVELVRRRHNALWGGDTSRHGNDDSRADLALCNLLAFYCHNDEARIDRLFRQSGLMREKWDRADYRARTIGRATAGRTEFYDPNYHAPAARVVVDGRPPDGGPGVGSEPAPRGRAAGEWVRPTITVGTDEYEAVCQVLGVLARADRTLYDRAGRLVSVVCDPPVGGHPAAPRIVELATPEVRTRITRYARLERFNPRSGQTEPTNPPNWLAPAVVAATARPDLRPLAAVTTSPVLRPDGTVHQTPGYDPATAILYVPGPDTAPIPEHPTREDARAAVDRVLAGVGQFRWRSRADQAAWLSLCLTLAARHAFAGPAPLYAGIANRPGLGKTALTKAAALIGTGRPVPQTGFPAKLFGQRYSDDAEELRKITTAVLAAGYPVYCLDNVPSGHGFGSPALDSVVTSEAEAGRPLMTSTVPTLAAKTVWTVNGNNIRPVGDTVRRTLPFRLVDPDGRAAGHEYDGPELTEWAARDRAGLFAACLTVVAAYIRAGRPDQQLPHFASFEGWSGTVRSAVVWAGLPDPWLTQLEFSTSVEDDQEAARLMEILFELAPGRGALTAAEIVAALAPDVAAERSGPLRHPAALFALRTLIPTGEPSTERLGKLFRRHRGREVGGRCIAGRPNRKDVVCWFVEAVQPQSEGCSGAEYAGDAPENAGDRGASPAPSPAPQPPSTDGTCGEVPGMPGISADPRVYACAPAPAHACESEIPHSSPASPAGGGQGLTGQRLNGAGDGAGDRVAIPGGVDAIPGTTDRGAGTGE